MRLQNSGKNKTSSNKDCQGALSAELVLPSSEEVFLALKSEETSWSAGKLRIIIKADKSSQLKARINSQLRIYESLQKIEEAI